MSSLLSIMMMVLLTIASQIGCRREQSPSAPTAGNADTEQSTQLKNWEALNQEFAAAEALTAQGKSDEAVVLLQTAMERQVNRDWQSDIFIRILQTLIASGQIEKAQEVYLVQAANNPQLAIRCFGAIEQNMLGQQQYPALLAWCDKLQEIQKLPEEILLPLADIKIQVLKATGQTGAEMQVLRQLAPRLNPANVQGLATRIGTTLIQTSNEPQFKELLAFLDQQLVQHANLRMTRANLQMQWFAARSLWDEAVTYFHALDGQLTTDDISTLYANLLSGLGGAAQYEVLDRESMLVLKNTKAPAGMRDNAARWYMTSCVQRGQALPAIERLKELRGMGFSADYGAQWLDRLYPTLMRQETPGPEFKPVIAYAESLLGDAQEKWARSLLAGIILDMTFRVEMFDTALRILEQGVPDQKPEWHAMMINKVKAHIALKAERFDEAYERFVNFMKDSAMRMDEMLDPVTGERITRDMVLALNEKRLGDILVKMNRTAEAEATYAKAREHYAKALKTTEAGSAQFKRLTEESNTIPPAK